MADQPNVQDNPFHLEEATIDELHQAIKAGRTTCVAVVEHYIARVRAFNGVACALVTEDGGPIPEPAGAVRGMEPLRFPTQTVKASTILPDLDKYRGPPLEFGRMEPTASNPDAQQQFGMIVGIPNARQVNALATLNIRGERSVTCHGDFDRHPSLGPLPPGAPPVCEYFRHLPDALERAAELDAAYGRNPDLAKMPMYGVVFSFKDPFDTKDMRSTGGGDACYDIDFPARDHVLVEQLRNKGAIIFAKAVNTEYNGRAGDPGGRHKPEKVLPSTLGYQRSTWGGNPANPYDTKRSASLGSSSGSGVSVSTNMVMASLGEETRASCRGPSNHNAVALILPHKSMLGFDGGAIGADIYCDRSGIHCRAIGDCAKILDAMKDPVEGYYDPREGSIADCLGRARISTLSIVGVKPMRFSNCIGLGIATIVTAIIAVCAPSTAQNTVAQNAGDIINLFGGIVRSTIAQGTQGEWRKLSENEIACVDQALHQRGSSLQAIIRQGITPSDRRVADLRSNCQNQSAQQRDDAEDQPVDEGAESAQVATPQSRKQGEFARLTEIPASCQAARRLGPQPGSRVDQFAGREAQNPACQVIWDCRNDLFLQGRGALNYLKGHPPIANALRDPRSTRDGEPSGPSSLFKELASRLNTQYGGFVCHYAQSQIDEMWVSLNPNSGQKRTFDVFAAASQTLLNKIRSDFKTEDAEYSDLSAFNDRYAGVERFDRSQAEYRQAFEDDDVSRMIQASSAILADLNKARARQQLLIRQSLQITQDQETLSDLSSAFDREELSRFGSHNPAMFTELSTDLQREAQDAPAKRGDITAQLQILETRLHGVEDAVLGARSNKAKAEQTRLMIAQRENAAEEFINAASREDLKGAFVNEQFVQSANEVKNRLSTLRSTELWLIGDKKGEIQAAMQQLEPLAQRMAAAQFSVDFNKLQERINTRGKNLLDNPSSSQFKELSDFLTSLKQEKFPLTTEARKAFAQNQSFLNSLSATIDGVMDQEEKRQALARQMAALSPEARAFIERHPEYQAGKNSDNAMAIFTVLYAADVSLEYCTEQAWFSEHRKPLAEVRRRENLIEVVLGIQGIEATKIAELKAAWVAKAKDPIRYAIKYEDGGAFKACDSLVVSLSLNQPW